MKSLPFLFASLLVIQAGNSLPIHAATITALPDSASLNVDTEQQPIEKTTISPTEWQTWRDAALLHINAGQIKEAEAALQKSLSLLNTLKDQPQYDQWQARVLDVKGKIQLLQGENENALKTWQQAATIYQQYGDNEHFTQAVLNQIQALQNLGYYHQASKQLEQSLIWLNQQPNSPTKVKALKIFGDIAQHLGETELAHNKLTEAIEIATKEHYVELLPELDFSLANLHEALGETLNAAQVYQSISEETILGLQAQINLLKLVQNDPNISQKINLIFDQQTTNILARLDRLPASRPVLYARINFVKKLLREAEPASHLIQEQLMIVDQQAQELGDRHSQAYALGTLGELYLKDQRLLEAQNLTEQALVLSQSLNAPDLTYQWQWQLGKIYHQEKKYQEAIAAYQQALNNLDLIRSDLVAIRSEVQFSFREDIEPVYREFADLLLQEGATQKDLQQARVVIEKLKLAELDNFFRDACLDAKPTQIDQIDPHAAIFYTIILSDRLEVIVALPNQPLEHYAVTQTTGEIEKKINAALTSLTRIKTPHNVRSLTQPLPEPFQRFDHQPLKDLYQSLIQPILPTLQTQQIQTVVFVPDGALQRIPMASLYDGKQYLIEQFNVAIAPSLELIDPTPLKDGKYQVISAGISKSIKQFDALPNVESELKQIQQETQSQILLNEEFTKEYFSQKIEDLPYEVVHIASHGEFSSRLEETYILTWDSSLGINDLQALLKGDRKQLSPIELLVLSACTTAKGDSRAALGLAGVAVRSGARSTIASLWSVDDDATAILMGHFYRYLTQGKLTKAEALRQAQRDLLTDPQFSHPYYWSAFTLIGNWL